jgi:septal ring factor EnvC (AmiA/AmiB activator)
VQQPNACTSANVNSSSEVITIDQQALTPTTNRTVKDPRSTVNPSNDTEYSNKELRQKEMKLKKKEDEIKKSKAEIEDCSKDNHRLKSYSLKLEAQVKELENSNRILRMKVVGSDDAVQHIKVNTNENMHTVPHCGPKRDENLHYTHQWQQNSDIQYPNNPLNDMNHLTNTAEVGLLKERISHLEETRLLYRRINDLEVNVIHQKINNLERTVNNMNHNSQNLRYQDPVTQSFLPQPVQTVYQQGQNYYPQAYSYPHMATIWPPISDHHPRHTTDLQFIQHIQQHHTQILVMVT